MTTGNSIKPQGRNLAPQNHDPIPYFSRTGAGVGLWGHLSSHLFLKRRNTTTNPYMKSSEGFHTTFYEIRKTSDANELWKQGPLYDHPQGWFFRKSAYTVSQTLFTNLPLTISDAGIAVQRASDRDVGSFCCSREPVFDSPLDASCSCAGSVLQ